MYFKLNVYIVGLSLFSSFVQSQFFPPKQEYDFIIVGAGTAGCVLANRLSENPDWRVLILEAGHEENFFTDIPLFTNLISATEYNWKGATESQNDTCLAFKENKCKMPRGKALGGSSVINHMVYTRGSSYDYDTWASLGNYGWSYNDVLPYFQKVENLKIPELVSKWRGTDGLLTIEYPDFRTKLSSLFIEAGKEMGYEVNDPNGENPVGFSYIQQTLRNGRRCSSAKAYLNPARQRNNLYVSPLSEVIKILIEPENKIAYGVQYIKDGRTYEAKATKEVIVSAGVLASPKLLMLSGVGPKEHLEELGIKVIEDLPVGYNLRDHVAHHLYVLIENKRLVTPFNMWDPVMYFDYLLHGKGPLTSSRAEALAFIKLDNSTSPPGVPDVELIMAGTTFTPIIYNAYVNGVGLKDRSNILKGLSGKEIFIMPVALLQPQSKGRVLLRSNDPRKPAIIDSRYLSEEYDVEGLTDGIMKALELLKTKAMKKLGAKLHDVKFPDCAQYEMTKKEYWRCAIRQYTLPFQHQTGTCTMGPVDLPGSVVDPELRVKNIKGLRVVDTSVLPSPPRAHTQAAVYMVAEKASDMIKNSWSA